MDRIRENRPYGLSGDVLQPEAFVGIGLLEIDSRQCNWKHLSSTLDAVETQKNTGSEKSKPV